MADVQTLYQLMLRNIHQDASSSNQKTIDSILRAISESLKYLRAQEVYFNEKLFTIQLESGKNSYALPQDFLGIKGEVQYKQSLSDSLQSPLTNTTLDHFLISRPTDIYSLYPDITPTSYFVSSEPDHNYYAVDVEGRLIYIGKQSGYVSIKYLADLGTIQYKHDGSNWIFYIPGTDTTLTHTSTYTNRWFKDGFDVLKTRTEYYLWSREFGNTEPAAARAQIALGQSMDALASLQNEGRARSSNSVIRRHL